MTGYAPPRERTCAGDRVGGTPSRTTLRHVRDLLARTSAAFEERRTGEYAVSVRPPALGAPDTDVIALCDSPVDHVVIALLTAAVMDVTGGVVQAELHEDHVPVVTGLPGLVALTAGPLPTAFGTASFLRAWRGAPASGS
ncbi:DUF6368 family protein [Streptomyces sp. NPDC057197]|uniref:DUF6368 family protein n=1 Tax=unclassified Streptomyces TaxID=2593676 RepID=UPI0033B64192